MTSSSRRPAWPAAASVDARVAARGRPAWRTAVRRHLPALVLFSVLAAVHTWPLVTDPAGLSLNDNADAMLNEWIVAWIAHQLPRDISHLFDGNIFHPATNTLAFSEPLLLPALIAAPLLWLGASPVFAYNVLLLAGFALTGLAAYAVGFAWTRDRAAALVAGSLFAFNTHTLTRMPHLQAIHAYALPLVLLFTDRVIRAADRRSAAGLAGAMAAAVYTSGYLAVFGVFAVAVALLTRIGEWIRSPLRVLAACAAASVLTAAVALPVALAYRRAAAEHGMVRSIENVGQFSATSRGYLASTGRVHFTTWSNRFFRTPVDTFFPGVVVLGLAGIGIWRGRRMPEAHGRIVMLCGLAITGFVLSLGVRTPVYGWLYAVFPPMQGLRAASRFGNLFLLAVALLGAYGLAAMRQRMVSSRWNAAAAAAVILLVNVESLRAPIAYRRFDGIPRIYSLLAQEPGPVVLAETPFYPAHAAFQNGEYVLNSTAHWRPLMNGYSGYTPASYRRIAWTFWNFPREDSVLAMREAGVTHFTVHPERYGERLAWATETLARRTDIELIAVSAAGGIRLYRFR